MSLSESARIKDSVCRAPGLLWWRVEDFIAHGSVSKGFMLTSKARTAGEQFNAEILRQANHLDVLHRVALSTDNIPKQKSTNITVLLPTPQKIL